MAPQQRPKDSDEALGFLTDLIRQVRLLWRLLNDSRVPAWVKTIPAAVLVYLIFPIDLLPDPVLGLGQLDDLAIFLVGLRLFIDICPPELVAEHRRGADPATPDAVWKPSQGPVIDVEATDVSDDSDTSGQEEA